MLCFPFQCSIVVDIFSPLRLSRARWSSLQTKHAFNPHIEESHSLFWRSAFDSPSAYSDLLAFLLVVANRLLSYDFNDHLIFSLYICPSVYLTLFRIRNSVGGEQWTSDEPAVLWNSDILFAIGLASCYAVHGIRSRSVTCISGRSTAVVSLPHRNLSSW